MKTLKQSSSFHTLINLGACLQVVWLEMSIIHLFEKDILNFPSATMSSLEDACTSSFHLSRNTFTMRAKFSFRLYRWRGVKNDKLTFPKSYENELKKKVEKIC